MPVDLMTMAPKEKVKAKARIPTLDPLLAKERASRARATSKAKVKVKEKVSVKVKERAKVRKESSDQVLAVALEAVPAKVATMARKKMHG